MVSALIGCMAYEYFTDTYVEINFAPKVWHLTCKNISSIEFNSGKYGGSVSL
jgi:hypothetical protein